MRHKHADLIIAWANGAEIQFREYAGEWNDFQPNGYACWHQDMEYRIKPEPKPDWFKYVKVEAIETGFCRWDNCFPHFANLKLTFDGETNELKDAKVIK